MCEYWGGRASHNHHMFGAPLRYIFSHAFGVNDSGDMLTVCPAALSFEVEMETEMQTNLGNIFIRRQILQNREMFVLRTDVPATFRYEETNLLLEPNQETVLYF